MSLLQTLAQPIQELQRGLAQVEQQVVLEARGEDLSEKASFSDLLINASAQESLKEVAVVQEQLVYEPELGEMSEQDSLSALKTLAAGKEESLKEVTVVQEQLVYEPELGEMSEHSELQTLAVNLSRSQLGNLLVEEQMVFDPAVEDLSTTSTGIQIWADPVQEVLKQLAIIQEQYAVEFSSSFTEEEDISGLRMLAQPIQSLHQALIQIGEQIVLEGDTELSQRENLLLLATLAKPIQDLQSGIAQITHQHVLEPSPDSMSEKVDISLLKTLAQPLRELERKIVLIEEQEVLEGILEPMSEGDTLASELPTLASVDSMHIGVVDEQFALDADVETLSDLTDVEQIATLGLRSQREVAVVLEHEVYEGELMPMSAASSDGKEVAVVQEQEALTQANVDQTQTLEDIKQTTKEGLSVTDDEKKRLDESEKEEMERVQVERKKEENKRKKSEVAERLRLEEEERVRRQDEEAEKCRAELEERIRHQEEAEKGRLELVRIQDEQTLRDRRLQLEEQELIKKEEEAKIKVEEAQRDIMAFEAKERELKEIEDKRNEKDLKKRALDEEEEIERKTALENEEREARNDVRKKKENEEAELKRATEIAETKKKEESELKKAEEIAETKKKEEAERNKAEEIAETKNKEEVELKKAEVLAEIKKKEEAELKKAEEIAETKKKEEAELKKAEEIAETKKKEEEAERNKAEELAETKKKEEAKSKKATEIAETKKKKEAELTKAEEVAESKKKEEAELKIAEEIAETKKNEEAKRKKAEEIADTKKKEEAELKKAVEIAETKKKEEAELKKAEEIAETTKKEEAERKKAEELAETKTKEEVKRKKIEEIAETKRKEEAEIKKGEEIAETKKKEEAERMKAEEIAETKKKEEAELKKAKEMVETKKKEETERKKAEEIADTKKKEEAERKKAEELAETKKKEEVERRKIEEIAETKKKEEAELRKAEEIAETKKKEEAERKKTEEIAETKKKEEAKEIAETKKKEEVEIKKAEVLADTKRKEEAELKKAEEIADAKKKEEAELQKAEKINKSKKKEEAERKKAEEIAETKKKVEAELKKAEAIAETKKKEEAERKKAEEVAVSKKKEEAELKKAKEVAETKKKEEAERKKAQEIAETLKKEETELKKAEEVAETKKKEEDERKKAEDIAETKMKEAQRKKAEEIAETQRKEEAERKKAEEIAETKKKEEAELKKAEEIAETKKKEEVERKKDEEIAETKKKVEAELKKAEANAETKKKEEAERKKTEEIAETKKKEEAERKKTEEIAETKKKEEAERKKAEEVAETKKKEEAERKKTEEIAETKKKEEAERKKAEEVAVTKKKEEAEFKKAIEVAETKRKEEAERKKAQEIAETLKKEETELKKAEEVAETKKKEEDERKKAEDIAETKMKEEAERKKAEEIAETKKKEEAELKKAEEIAETKKKEEVESKKAEEIAETKKKEEAERKKAEEIAETNKKEEAERKKADEIAETKKKEEAERKKAEDIAETKMKEEAERKKAEEFAETQKKEEAERKKAEEIAETKKKEEEAELKNAEVIAETKRKEEAELKKVEEIAETKKKEEAELKKAEKITKTKKKEEAERKKAEEIADTKKKEEAELKKAEEIAETKKKEEVERKKAEDLAETKKKEEAERKKAEDLAETKKKEEAERKKAEELAESKKKEEAERKMAQESVDKRKRSAKSKAEKDAAVCLSDQKMVSPKNRVESIEASSELAPEKPATVDVPIVESEQPRRRRRPSEETSPDVPSVDVRRRRSRADVSDVETIRRRPEPPGVTEMDSVLQRPERPDVDIAMDLENRRVNMSAARRARSFDQMLEADDHVSALRRPPSRGDDAFSDDWSVSSRKSHIKETGGHEKKPTFCTRLTDRTAAQGSRIKLMCSVLGSPEPSVQWLCDGLPIQLRKGEMTKFRPCLDDGLAVLEVLNASPSDSGEYTCLAHNLHGETSTSATLRVFAAFEAAPFPPTFTRGIRDMYHFSDDELVLECRVRSQPPPRITWLKDAATLRPSGRYMQSELADGVCRLTVRGPEATDSGQYTCRAENAVWSDQLSHMVQFAGRESHMTSRRMERAGLGRVSRDARRPHFSSVLTDHLVPSGGTIALQVEVRGVSRPEVTWLRGTELLQQCSRVRTFEEGGVYTLMVREARDTEAGLYTCRAVNKYGNVTTSAAVEVVRPGAVRGGKSAMFMSRPDQDMSVALGEDVTVSFRVQGDPKPRVIWMKGTRDITHSARALKETLDDYVRLTLKRALPSDAGTYCILAKNVYGCDRAFVTVQIRQRARSLTPSMFPQDTVTILRDVRDSVERARLRDVPGAVGGEPVLVESGKNWLTLAWPKGEQRGGVPVIAYKVEAWMLGQDGGARWTEMGISPINSFDAFNLKPGSEYQFRVTPRNRYGWGESVTTRTPITVGKTVELPEFVHILPGQLKALHGSNIRLECQVRGDPAPEVQWYRDGTPLDLTCLRFTTDFTGSQCRLSIDDLRDEDSGRYMCEATNKKGRVSTFARLLVVTDPKIWQADNNLKRDIQEDEQGSVSDIPPQFTMRLRDRRVQMTYPVRLTCQVFGRPTPQVTWSRDGVELKQDGDYTFWHEEHFHTLELNHAGLEHSGCYSVTARNTHGAVSCRCHLVVDKGIRAYIAPDFLGLLEAAMSVREGGELRLCAQVEAYPSVGVMWHRDGVRLRPSRRTVMTLSCDGSVELALAAATLRDAGLYTCTATNEVGRAETSARVSVLATSAGATLKTPQLLPPEIPYSQTPLWVTKPRSTEALEGDTVIIQCEVVGDPKPEVYWLRDFLKPDYYRDAPHFRRLGDGPQYRLEIPRAKLDFTGAYSVIARNVHGEVKAVISLQIYCKGQGREDVMEHNSVKLGKVQTLPIIKRELKDLRCCDGDAATLECSVYATPTPDVRWEKEGRLVPLGGDFHAEFDGDVARLTVHQVYPEDEGEYTCVVYNELGKAATSACLLVDVPEEKETLLSSRLSRPPGLMSSTSTPMSTPRTTPSRSKSPSVPRHREPTPSSYSVGRAPRRLKVTSPKFYAVPHNRVAEEGETVRFQCAIAGHPTPWVTWDKEGCVVTPGARLTITEKDDLRVLELSEVTQEDAGLYRITLENEVGRIEASARLEVIGHYGSSARGVRAWSASPRTSPTFGRRLVGSAARLGNRLTLDCEIRGVPTPTPSWYRNGELIVRTERLTPTWDGRVARLDVAAVEVDDAGVYCCMAENDAGVTQCWARVTVIDTDDPTSEDRRPPSVVVPMRDVTVVDGHTIELNAQLQGAAPMDVVWSRDGVELPDCPDLRYVQHDDGRVALRLADVFPEDAGVYRCDAFNEHGDAYTSGRLTVTEAATEAAPSLLQFTKMPVGALAAPGGHASFCVRLCGAATSVRWRLSDKEVVDGHSRYQTEQDGDTYFLHITDVDVSDTGVVLCTATSSSGVVTCSAELSVMTDTAMTLMEAAPATLITGPADATVLRGDHVVLSARFTGWPTPTVRWLRAGRELESDARLHIVIEDGETRLSLDDITADEGGKYVISVENIHGADCHFASVAVEGPPDPPSNAPSVSTSDDGVSCMTAWSSAPYDGGCIVTGYRVEMRDVATDTWGVVAEAAHGFSQVVHGLAPGRGYQFRVRAINVHGASRPSAESQVFRLDASAPGNDEGSFTASFEPREVHVEPGGDFKQRFEVLEELGKGRFGVVHKVSERASGQRLAAKFIRCIKLKDREKVQEEIDIMNCLRHPKLLQLAAAFENPREVVMVLELISGGELFERVVADDFTLTERDCVLFMRQIVQGVEYMHSNSVVHLDLKPENIMCYTRTSHQIKLIDFGLAKKLDPATPVRVLFGTPEFIPPEIINYEVIGLASDMWSVGVICYVLLSGLSPFMGDSDADTFANITRAYFDFDDEAFDAISQESRDFISALLVEKKEKRLTATQCLQHKWLAQHDEAVSCVKLCTDKLKKFIIRRKWQLIVPREGA